MSTAHTGPYCYDTVTHTVLLETLDRYVRVPILPQHDGFRSGAAEDVGFDPWLAQRLHDVEMETDLAGPLHAAHTEGSCPHTAAADAMRAVIRTVHAWCSECRRGPCVHDSAPRQADGPAELDMTGQWVRDDVDGFRSYGTWAPDTPLSPPLTLEEVVDEAEAAFWAVVAEHYPHKSGHSEPSGLPFELQKAVALWLGTTTPTEG